MLKNNNEASEENLLVEVPTSS
jgi:hypothetical protein